jgi:uncharacterized Zn-finger protein
MADVPVVPHYHNAEGAEAITIGAHEFMCVGAPAPFDHPHIFIDMGAETTAVCPYCSTLYRYDHHLKPHDTVPPGHFYVAADAA